MLSGNCHLNHLCRAGEFNRVHRAASVLRLCTSKDSSELTDATMPSIYLQNRASPSGRLCDSLRPTRALVQPSGVELPRSRPTVYPLQCTGVNRWRLRCFRGVLAVREVAVQHQSQSPHFLSAKSDLPVATYDNPRTAVIAKRFQLECSLPPFSLRSPCLRRAEPLRLRTSM